MDCHGVTEWMLCIRAWRCTQAMYECRQPPRPQTDRQGEIDRRGAKGERGEERGETRPEQEAGSAAGEQVATEWTVMVQPNECCALHVEQDAAYRQCSNVDKRRAHRRSKRTGWKRRGSGHRAMPRSRWHTRSPAHSQCGRYGTRMGSGTRTGMRWLRTRRWKGLHKSRRMRERGCAKSTNGEEVQERAKLREQRPEQRHESQQLIRS